MPLKEQMKFDIRAQEVEFNEGDPQLDADGGATINFGSAQSMMAGHNENLAESMSEGDLAVIARELSNAYDGYKDSRSDWASTYAEGLDLLGMTPGVGNAADLLNAALYASKGDKSKTLLSLASAVPVTGQAATFQRMAEIGELTEGDK